MATIAAARVVPRRRILESPIAGPVITVVGTFVLFSLFVPHFFEMRTLSGIVNAATLTGIITVGVTLLMIAGEFDLSVGPMMAWAAFLFGSVTMKGGNTVWAILIALLVPAAMGALNGLIFIRTRIPSFIITLGTQFIYRGALYVYSTGLMLQTIEDKAIYKIFNGRLDLLAAAIPGANFRTSLFWLLGVVLVFQYILTRTRFGSHIFAVGGNPGAAASQGVNVRRTKLAAFILTGLLAGFSGILLFSQFGTARIATGAGEELKAIAAAVVGGTLLTGGSGSIIGALLGVLLISMLRSGVVLLNLSFIPADNFEAVVGVTIVAAAMFNNWIRSRS